MNGQLVFVTLPWILDSTLIHPLDTPPLNFKGTSVQFLKLSNWKAGRSGQCSGDPFTHKRISDPGQKLPIENYPMLWKMHLFWSKTIFILDPRAQQLPGHKHKTKNFISNTKTQSGNPPKIFICPDRKTQKMGVTTIQPEAITENQIVSDIGNLRTINTSPAHSLLQQEYTRIKTTRLWNRLHGRTHIFKCHWSRAVFEKRAFLRTGKYFLLF